MIKIIEKLQSMGFDFTFAIWPPGQTLTTIALNPTYQLAARYFCLNLALVLMALLWGASFAGMLIRREKDRRSTLHLSSFIFICIGTGLALVIAELFSLVLLRTLTPGSVIFLFTTTSVLACYLLYLCWRDIQRIISFANKSNIFTTVTVLLFLCIYQFSSISPWTLGDATKYHVPYADFFLLNKGISAISDYFVYPYQSLNLNILFSLGLLIDRDLSFIQTIHASFATLTLFGIYVFCINAISRQKLCWVLLLLFVFSKIYIVYFSRIIANVDLGSMYFILSAVFSLYLWINFRSKWLLILSAISFGIAIGTKYLMCIFALPIAICILLNEGRNWRPLLTYIIWAAVWGLWWYIRNFIYTGNPVHPFASNIFGLYLWDESDVISQMQSLLAESIPKTIRGFLLMPYYAFIHPIASYQGPFLVIAILYTSTLFCWLLNRAINSLLIFCWIYLALWFIGAQDSRYLMPIMPLVFVYCGFVLDALFSSFFCTRTGKVLSGLLLTTVLIATAMFSQQLFYRVFYCWAGEPADLYENAMRQNKVYDLISHANEIFGPHATVYEFAMGDGRWFFKGTLAGNQFGPHSYSHIIAASTYDNSAIMSPVKLESVLKERYNAEGFLIAPPPYMPYDANEFNTYFDLKYQNDIGFVYKFRH